MVEMTNEQFAWKVFCEAPMEFLQDEMNLDSKILGTMFGRQIYDAILEGSYKLTDKEKETFIAFHCDSIYPVAQ